MEGVISRDHKACKVDEEFSGDIEENQKKVYPNESEEGIDLRNGGLPFELVEERIFRQLYCSKGINMDLPKQR